MLVVEVGLVRPRQLHVYVQWQEICDIVIKKLKQTTYNRKYRLKDILPLEPFWF